MNFLIVDDSATMRVIIIRNLMALGFSEFHQAADGKEALDIYSKGGIDVLITDWNMPSMNGLELVKRVRKHSKDLPILMVTTNSAKDDIIEGLKAGVSTYATKPLTAELLQQKLRAITNLD